MKDTAISNSSRAEGERKAKRLERGFTLLEVVVALAVLAFAFVGLLGLHGRDLKAVWRIEQFNRATLLARELMTQMQFEDFASLGDASGTFEAYPGFRWEREVLPTNLETVKQVRLRVIWDESRPDAVELRYFFHAPAE